VARLEVRPVDHRAVRPEDHQVVLQVDLLVDHQAVFQVGSLIEHRLDTGPRTEHPLRQYRALFQFRHEQWHEQPLLQAHLTRFQSGLVHQGLFR
jgi:hypothetical protein